MANNIQMDEFHLGLYAPSGLRPAAYRAVQKTLNDPRFCTALRRAIRGVIARQPSLSRVRCALTR